MNDKPELKTIRLQMVISPSNVGAIDKWRRKQPDIPSRSEAIRRLIRLGLMSANHQSNPPIRAG